MKYKIDPRELGLSMYTKEEVAGGTADENAVITREVLSGEEQGAKRDIVLLNAGAALYTIGKAVTMKEGVELARQAIDSGKALAKLDEFVQYTNAC